ncbi:hypothetical protein ACPFUP_001942 [Vibrio cholerae]
MTKNSKVSRALAGLLLTLLGPVLAYRDFIPPSFEKIEIEENYDVVDKSNLIQRVIGFDESLGVYSEKDILKARALADKWIQHAASFYSPPDALNVSTMREYLKQLNDDLRSYFYYGSDSAIISLSNQFADCDLYSYLLIDVAKKHNIELKLVFSPSHAFLLWENAQGIDLLWESTASKPVNLGNDSFYKISNSSSDYRPVEESEIFDRIILDFIGHRHDDFSEREIKSFAIERAELTASPILKLRWLMLANEINLDKGISIADKYEPLIKQVYQEHPSFILLPQLLAKYYYDKGEYSIAATYINNTLSFPNVSAFDLKQYITMSDQMFLDKLGTIMIASIFYLFEVLSGEVLPLKTLLNWLLFSIFVTVIFAYFPHITSNKTKLP